MVLFIPGNNSLINPSGGQKKYESRDHFPPNSSVFLVASTRRSKLL